MESCVLGALCTKECRILRSTVRSHFFMIFELMAEGDFTQTHIFYPR